MGLATYLPRCLPLVYLTNRRLPGWASEWLDLIPAAILSALLVPALLPIQAGPEAAFLNAGLLAAVPTLIFGLATRSLAGTVVVGMVCYRLIQNLL